MGCTGCGVGGFCAVPVPRRPLGGSGTSRGRSGAAAGRGEGSAGEEVSEGGGPIATVSWASTGRGVSGYDARPKSAPERRPAPPSPSLPRSAPPPPSLLPTGTRGRLPSRRGLPRPHLKPGGGSGTPPPPAGGAAARSGSRPTRTRPPSRFPVRESPPLGLQSSPPPAPPSPRPSDPLAGPICPRVSSSRLIASPFCRPTRLISFAPPRRGATAPGPAAPGPPGGDNDAPPHGRFGRLAPSPQAEPID
jgi:hypothetical protein